jgi:hypothetical protein
MKKKIKIILFSIGGIFLLLLIFFFTIKKLDKQAIETKNFAVSNYNNDKVTLLPSTFINGERFYIKLPIAKGDTVLAFGDSGGGISMLLPSTIEKKQLQSKLRTGLLKGMMPVKYLLFEDLVDISIYPPPVPLRNLIVRDPFASVTRPFLIVPPTDDQTRLMAEKMPEMDIFLGQNFFMGKSWTIDYKHQQIWVNTPIYSEEKNKPNVQKIGFKKNSHQENIFGHASMSIEVDGEVIDVLFDTGATIMLSDEGKNHLITSANTIGGSFIAASIFDKWRNKHPDWKYYPKSDRTEDIIEVPFIKLGGLEVGPVLFSKRRDEAWSEGMINSMDKIVKGAIGGSALKYVKVMVDYNTELIKFER